MSATRLLTPEDKRPRLPAEERRVLSGFMSALEVAAERHDRGYLGHMAARRLADRVFADEVARVAIKLGDALAAYLVWKARGERD